MIIALLSRYNTLRVSEASCIVYNLPHIYKMYSLFLKPSSKNIILLLDLLHMENIPNNDNSKKKSEDIRVQNSVQVTR